MKHMKTIIFTMLLMLMSTAAQALVWEYGGPFWYDAQTGQTYEHETIDMGESATAYSGNFGSMDGSVNFRAELRDAQGNTVKVLEQKVVDVSTYTGFETVDIAPSDYSEAGDYFVHFRLSDSHNTLIDHLDLTVLPAQQNTCPVFSETPDKQVNEGELLTFTVSATDADGDSLAYSASGLPAGATFSRSTGAFTWTPDFDQAGEYDVTFIVSDGECQDTMTVHITVVDVPGNVCPLWNELADQQVSEGELLAFTVGATDADGDALAYSASGLPDGATFSGANRTFLWTPDFDQAGEYNITFTVSDGECDVDMAVHITVLDNNRCPVWGVVPDQQVTEGNLLEFHVGASDADADNDLVFRADMLPAGAAFDADSQMFSWTPALGQAGTHDALFIVDDQHGCEVPLEVTITVNPAGSGNHAPVADFEWFPQVPDVGETVVFTSTSSDPDNDTLTCDWDFDDDGLFDDADTCTAEWVFDTPGDHDVSLLVSDGSLTDDVTKTVTVEGQLNVDSIECLSPIVEGSSGWCTIDVDASGQDVAGINVELFYIDGTPIGNCVTAMTGACSLDFPAPEVGTHTVYAHAELFGWQSDWDADPTAEFEVVAQGFEIRDFDVYNEPTFTQWDYDFFRGEDMYVSFRVVDMQGNPMDGMVTSVHLTSPPGGQAEFTEFPYPNPDDGMYYYHLTIPATHAFLGDSQVFTFAFNVEGDAGAEYVAQVVIRNNPPVIDPLVVTEFHGTFDQETSLSLTPYESDVEDSGADLTWSVTGVNTNVALVSIGADDTMTVTPVTDGSTTATLWLTDLDGDTDTIDVTINTEGGQQLPECSDGLDNDGDGWVDMDDPGCSSPDDDDESDDPQLPQCNDGIDNDNDGLIDWPADPGCSGLTDDDESDNPQPETECSDGIDNDNDGWTDMDDPGCSDPTDNDESDDPVTNLAPVAELVLSLHSAAPGAIIDADGSTSYDPDGTVESYTFVMLDQNGNVAYSDSGLGVPGSWQFQFVNEGLYTLSLTVTDDDGASDADTEIVTISASGNAECNDGIDNDGDGLIDMDDPGCHDINDNMEGEIHIPVEQTPFNDQDRLLVTRIDIDGQDIADAVAMAGDFFRLGLTLENNMDINLEDIRVEVSIDELQARSTGMVRELDEGDSANVGLVMEVPYNADPGLYDMRIVISNDDVRRVKYRTVTIV